MVSSPLNIDPDTELTNYFNLPFYFLKKRGGEKKKKKKKKREQGEKEKQRKKEGLGRQYLPLEKGIIVPRSVSRAETVKLSETPCTRARWWKKYVTVVYFKSY